MIALSNITKQYGRQVLFVDASFQLRTGEKIGLVGPNGAGKTTIFRMIAGEERPDDGDVSIPKRTTIGYFRQDVESMGGNSTLDEAIAGSGRVGELHHRLAELERDMSDPDKADRMDRTLARFGDVQEEYQQRGGYDEKCADRRNDGIGKARKGLARREDSGHAKADQRRHENEIRRGEFADHHGKRQRDQAEGEYDLPVHSGRTIPYSNVANPCRIGLVRGESGDDVRPVRNSSNSCHVERASSLQ